MSTLLVILVVAVACAGTLVLLPRSASAEPPPKESPMPKSPKPPGSKEDLAQKLEAVRTSSPKVEERPQAMCYRQAAPPETAEYVCPKCSARTLWTKDRGTGRLIQRLLPQLRAKLPIAGLKLSLDETQLCRQCTPKAPVAPVVILVVEHADGTVHRAEGVGPEDLDLLREFQEGKLVHEGARDERTALKEHLPRLQYLLGVTPKP